MSKCTPICSRQTYSFCNRSNGSWESKHIYVSLILLVLQVCVDYTEQDIAISEYPLSAALTCTKICSAFEEAWGIH